MRGWAEGFFQGSEAAWDRYIHRPPIIATPGDVLRAVLCFRLANNQLPWTRQHDHFPLGETQ